MATLDAPEPVNLPRSIFLCNVFTFFFSSAKACLFPFLVIYFKMLGLSATQVGVIIGVKTLVAFMFAPLWAKCAVRCGRQRSVLMISVFLMAGTYLSLTAVPSLNEDFTVECNIGNPENLTQEILNKIPEMASSPAPSKTVSVTVLNMTQAPILTNNTESVTQSTQTPVNVTKSMSANNITAPPKESATTKMGTVTEAKPTASTPTKLQSTTAGIQTAREVFKQILIQAGIPESKIDTMSEDELITLIQGLLDTDKGQDLLLKSLSSLPTEVSEELSSMLDNDAGGFSRHGRSVPDHPDEVNAVDADDVDADALSWDNFKLMLSKKWLQLKLQVKETENQMFTVILVILVVGEIFCSPVEKIADDSWFEFLESIDDLGKYGVRRVWSSLAYILFPLIVTVAVDHTSCLFGVNVHPFMLHFYMFGTFLGLTFFLAYFYPMTSTGKYKYASKVGKGIKTVCCTGRGFLFVLTLLIMGSIYASYYNFVFWMLIDMGSQEVTLGLCLTLASLSEIPMLLFSDKLLKKIGNGGVVAVSLLCLSGRMLYYSFLWTPWAVLPAELTHAFTHTAMWMAVLSSKGFNSTAALGRSIRSILSSIYFGIGFAFGSVLSGIIYDNFGPAILFQGGSVLAIAWFPVVCVCLRCCRESETSEVKYSRLLTSDDHSDDSSIDDDWLEQALKDR